MDKNRGGGCVVSLQLKLKLREVKEEMAEREEENRRKREQLAIRAEELQKELSLRYCTDERGSTHCMASLTRSLLHMYTQSYCEPQVLY